MRSITWAGRLLVTCCISFWVCKTCRAAKLPAGRCAHHRLREVHTRAEAAAGSAVTGIQLQKCDFPKGISALGGGTAATATGATGENWEIRRTWVARHDHCFCRPGRGPGACLMLIQTLHGAAAGLTVSVYNRSSELTAKRRRLQLCSRHQQMWRGVQPRSLWRQLWRP